MSINNINPNSTLFSSKAKTIAQAQSVATEGISTTESTSAASADTQTDVSAVLRDADIISSTISGIDEEIATCTKELESVNKELAAADEEISDISSEIKTIRSKVATIAAKEISTQTNAEIAELKERITELQGLKKQAEAKKAQLESQKASLEKQGDKLAEMKDKAYEIYDTVKKETEKIEKELITYEEQKTESEEIQKKYRDLIKQSSESSEATINKLKQELEELQQELESISKEIDSESGTLTLEIAALEAQKEASDKTLKEYEEKIDELTKAKKEVQEEYDAAKARADELQKQLDESNLADLEAKELEARRAYEEEAKAYADLLEQQEQAQKEYNEAKAEYLAEEANIKKQTGNKNLDDIVEDAIAAVLRENPGVKQGSEEFADLFQNKLGELIDPAVDYSKLNSLRDKLYEKQVKLDTINNLIDATSPLIAQKRAEWEKAANELAYEKSKMSAISKELQEQNKTVKSLEAELNAYDSQIEGYKELYEKEKANNESLTEQISKKKSEYKTKKEIYDKLVEQIKTKNEEIDQAEQNSGKDTEEYKERLESEILNYNKIIKKIEEKTKELTEAKAELVKAKGAVDGVDAAIEEQQRLLNSVNEQLKNVNDIIDKINSTIADITSAIEKAHPEDEDVPFDDIWKLIPEQEKNIVQERKLNLSEISADGTERYVIAKGSQDGIYHIYDLETDKSIARQYDDRFNSYTYCAEGNGYLYGFKRGDGAGSQDVFGIKDWDASTQSGKTEKYKATYTTSSPLAFDLEGDGIKTSSEKTYFDIDGDGDLDRIHNVNEWVLAFDADGNGKAGESGLEVFGNNTDLDGDGKADGYKDGFEALEALAKKEGLVNDTDDFILDQNDIEILSEKYGLTLTKGYGGESKSLQDAGITQINMSSGQSVRESNFDGKGNDIMRKYGATFTVNGKEHEYADVWNAHVDNNAKQKEAEAELEKYLNPPPEPDISDEEFEAIMKKYRE